MSDHKRYMSNADTLNVLRKIGACSEAVAWVESQGCTFGTLWRKCQRADWMLWLAARAGVDLAAVVRASCACARTALPYVPPDENRPLVAIETAERWSRGEATIAEVRSAAYAASAAAYAASAAASAASAASAAYYAARAAASAAAYFASAAAYFAADASDAAAAAELAKALSIVADLVREHITAGMVAEAMEKIQ